MSGTNALELQHVAGGDDDTAPVAGVDLVVPAGEALALLGPAGAGKSALLRLVSGFGTLTAGRILFNGHDLARVPPHRRPFALITERDALFPHMTVAANVAYGLRARGLGRGQSAGMVAEALAHAGAPGLEKAYPGALNRAERQKVSLARALAVEPLILLMDEPLGALDEIETGRVLQGLRDLQKQVGLTVILATSDGGQAMAFASRIAVMAAGRMVQVGRPAELYSRPDHAVTARMTGPVNLIAAGALTSGNAALTVDDGAALALRPDLIELHLQAPASGMDALEGVIERVTFSAAGMTAHVGLGRAGQTLMVRVDGRRLDADDLPEGRRVWCTWEASAACLVRLDGP